MCRKNEDNHLRLAFGREEGGGGGGCVERTKKNHLRLAFGREGGGSGGSLGVTGVSGGRKKNEWEKTGNDKCRCPFSRRTAWASHFLGPPSRFFTPNSLVG